MLGFRTLSCSCSYTPFRIPTKVLFPRIQVSPFSKTARLWDDKPLFDIFNSSPPQSQDKPPEKDDNLAALLSLVLEMKVAGNPSPLASKGNKPPLKNIQNLSSDTKAQLSLDHLVSSAAAQQTQMPISSQDAEAEAMLDDLLKNPPKVLVKKDTSGPKASAKPRRVFTISGRKVGTSAVKPRKPKSPAPSDEGFREPNFDFDMDEDDMDEGMDGESLFDMTPGSAQSSDSLDDVLEEIMADTKQVVSELLKEMKVMFKGEEKRNERIRKKMAKRWKNLANLRRWRKQDKEPGKPIPVGVIHPQFLEGFGRHFVPVTKKISPSHKLKPIINLYARKLARNGTYTWNQKYNGMKLILKYLHGRYIPDDHRPGITGIVRPVGTELINFVDVQNNKSKALDELIAKEDLKRGIVRTIEEKVGESIFQDEDLQTVVEEEAEPEPKPLAGPKRPRRRT